MRQLLLAGLAALLSFVATPAHAWPAACGGQTAQPNSPLLGAWNFRVRDDGADWRPWAAISFMADGTWWEQNQRAGIYCMIGDLVLLGYDDNTLGDEMHTVLRFRFDPVYMQGTESWDEGGTGDAEMRRQ